MKEILKTNLVATLREGGIELEDKAVDKILDALVSHKVIEFKNFKNLNGVSLGETPTAATFLVNGFIVSVYANSKEQKKYWDEYIEEVRENEVCDYEFTYEDFLRSKDLLDEAEETITVTEYTVAVEKVGKLYLSLKKRKDALEKELESINRVLPAIEPIIQKTLNSPTL